MTSTLISAEAGPRSERGEDDGVVLEARDVTRAYGRGANRFEALRGVSIQIRRGESVAVIGKSGSGKSTLMHLLALLDRPSSGSILLRGTDAARMSARALSTARNSEFGFVFQQFFLIPQASVLENVMLPLKIAGVAPRERRRRALEALEVLELQDKARNAATDLSGGQKQRTVIARALVTGPSVIFADEPTGNLDSATGAIVEDMLFRLNRDQGVTLVVVTHDSELADRCSRAVHIRDGLIEQADAA